MKIMVVEDNGIRITTKLLAVLKVVIVEFIFPYWRG